MGAVRGERVFPPQRGPPRFACRVFVAPLTQGREAGAPPSAKWVSLPRLNYATRSGEKAQASFVFEAACMSAQFVCGTPTS